MPPKKNRVKRTSTKSTESDKTLNTVAAETTDSNNDDIVDYQNQIKLLQQEIVEYKKQIETLQCENKMLKLQMKSSLSEHNNGIANLSIVNKNEMSFNNRQLSSPGGIKIKGCSCKGSCANRICGCVKKNMACSEFCKCNQSVCKNQDPDKENIEQGILSEEGENVLKTLVDLNLNKEVLPATVEKTRKSIFSPFSADRNVSSKEHIYNATPISFVTKRRLFTQRSDDLVEVKSNNGSENNSATDEDLQDVEENFDDVKKTTIHKVQHSPKILNNNLGRVPENQNINNLEINVNILSQKSKKVQHSPVSQSNNGAFNTVDDNKHDQLLKDNDTDKSKDQENIFYNQKCKKVQHSPIICTNTTSDKNSDSNRSISSDVNSNKDIIDASLNPMVPKRQLPRSPILTGASLIELQNTKKISPPKKELIAEEINWEQHQSELVSCKKCKRKFFPHRIDIHMKSCKKI